MSLEPGTVIGGDFEILSPLSSGGMGAVYIAQQKSVGRRRALKVMHRELVADTKLRDRFVQEAKIGATIESEHVVEVIAAGVDEKLSMPFLAMELLEGKDLAALIASRGALKISEVRDVVDQLCHALAAAHEGGIVHRDLKPENVFIARSKRRGAPFVVKVLDFGIAKILAEARATSSGTAALGTPTYMAPEQTESRGKVTPAADVWALGLIVFRALTGRHFWRSPNEESSSITALMREVIIDPIPRAAERAEEMGVASKLPDRFDTWFARCVARNPLERFANAAEAHEAIAKVEGFEQDAAAGPPKTSASPTDGGIAAELAQAPEAPAKALSAPQGSAKDVEPSGATELASPLREKTEVPVAGPTLHATPLHLDRAAGPKPRSTAPVIAVGALAVASVAAVGLYLTGGRSSGSANGPSGASASIVASDIPSIRTSSSASAPGDTTVVNRWVAITPANPPIVLGLANDSAPAKVRGLRPSRQVKSPNAAYAIQAHEVTWAELEPWLAATPAMKFPLPTNVPQDAGARAKLPAVGVPWEVAGAYCESVGGSLPTEAQWEFAARGAKKRTYAWGDARIDLLRTHSFAGYEARVVRVMTSEQDVTESGVHDLMGNAREWTASLWTDDAKGEAAPWVQEGDTTARVVRGWPLSAEPPADFKGVYAEYRDWACATGACSPLHPDQRVKGALRPIVVLVDATGGPSSPLRTWVSSPSFSMLVAACSGSSPPPPDAQWKLHGEGKTSTCSTKQGFLLKEPDASSSPYIFAQEAAPPRPSGDSDADGIADASDSCPNQPEDRDGFQDSDGCPDPDNDRDGVPDATDACPSEAGTGTNGCPGKSPEKPSPLDKRDSVPPPKESAKAPKSAAPPPQSSDAGCKPSTRIFITSSEVPADVLQCINDAAPVLTENGAWTDDVPVRVAVAQVPPLLAEIGFRCVRSSP